MINRLIVFCAIFVIFIPTKVIAGNISADCLHFFDELLAKRQNIADLPLHKTLIKSVRICFPDLEPFYQQANEESEELKMALPEEILRRLNYFSALPTPKIEEKIGGEQEELNKLVNGLYIALALPHFSLINNVLEDLQFPDHLRLSIVSIFQTELIDELMNFKSDDNKIITQKVQETLTQLKENMQKGVAGEGKTVNYRLLGKLMITTYLAKGLADKEFHGAYLANIDGDGSIMKEGRIMKKNGKLVDTRPMKSIDITNDFARKRLGLLMETIFSNKK